jgi:sulfide:quinone oxidoreductase
MKKVLILGGGFAGLETAISLAKKNFDVTVVSNRDYFYVYPISIWIPTRESSFENVSVPLSDISKRWGFNLIIDDVTSIQSQKNSVILQNQTLSYDILVVAMGSGKMKHDGIENTLSICGEPKMSLEIRDELDKLIEKGSGKIAFGFGGNPKDKAGVRGGPGFELLFNVHNLLKKKKIRENFDLTFFAPMSVPGARMGEKSVDTMKMMFDRYNIKNRYGKKIKSFLPKTVTFEDNSTLEADLIMFIPANAGHKVLESSDLPLSESGFIKINDFCEVEDCDNVYAIGDIASIQGPDWKAKQGHIAEVMARNTAHNIISEESNEGIKKGYQEHLNILCVMDTGDGAAFVYRDNKKAFMIPMPFIGHTLKKLWGMYAKARKLGKFPRIPGM